MLCSENLGLFIVYRISMDNQKMVNGGRHFENSTIKVKLISIVRVAREKNLLRIPGKLFTLGSVLYSTVLAVQYWSFTIFYNILPLSQELLDT